MKIAEKCVVSIDYSLHLGDGVIIDKSDGTEPLAYLHGVSQIVPGLEKALAGLEAGQSKKVVVPSAEGYGDRDPQKIADVNRKMFGNAPLKVGDEFIAVDDENNQVPARIQAVNGDKITVDFNHPLAGKDLHFDVTIREVRAATEEELQHGHAHDPNDHHHH